MAKEQLMTTATISSIQPGPSASSPYLVRTTDGQTIKGFKEKADELVIGKTYQIPYYDKDYEGASERVISVILLSMSSSRALVAGTASRTGSAENPADAGAHWISASLSMRKRWRSNEAFTRSSIKL